MCAPQRPGLRKNQLPQLERAQLRNSAPPNSAANSLVPRHLKRDSKKTASAKIGFDQTKPRSAAAAQCGRLTPAGGSQRALSPPLPRYVSRVRGTLGRKGGGRNRKDGGTPRGREGGEDVFLQVWEVSSQLYDATHPRLPHSLNPRPTSSW